MKTVTNFLTENNKAILALEGLKDEILDNCISLSQDITKVVISWDGDQSSAVELTEYAKYLRECESYIEREVSSMMDPEEIASVKLFSKAVSFSEWKEN